MANTKSAIKHIKTSEKRRKRNVAVKSATRTQVRKARQVIAQNPAEATEQLKTAISQLDRAAAKGVIHRNNAARRKSRLMKAYQSKLAQS
ncbi:MAG TPA: 30S ribosomal protein S20 [Chloroflexota bacterium]|nr:30S ribosomal protein S20 [Chloroflexota bacterium]